MSLRDQTKLKNNYKILENLYCPKNFINKKTILENFENTNKNIREDDNIISDNYYDNILNECLIDAGNEILEKERYIIILKYLESMVKSESLWLGVHEQELQKERY